MNILRLPIRLLLPIGLLLPLAAQVRINEFMASNTRSVPDVTDFEDYPDWIELHNPGAVAVSLDGYYLSDNSTDPFKWAIPAGLSIDAGGYLMIMADGHDAAPGEDHPRGYWPWRNFTTEKPHTNFNLSSDGESVVLTQATGLTTSSLISAGASWKYLDDGSTQSTQWRSRTYNDATWSAGPAPLGYGNNPTTEISFGPNNNDKHITSYFRHTFNLADPTIYTNLTIKLLVDDGAAVYLNGEELIRQNLPTGTLTSSTRAIRSISGSDETDFGTYKLPPSALVAGDNVIAVEAHQYSPVSSDLGFDLSIDATSFSSVATLDTIDYGAQVTDISYGRDSSNPALWQHFAEPTPGATNTTTAVADIRLTSPDVEISPRPGLYTSPETVTLTTTAGDIHYTLDGSNPTSHSPIYTTPLSVSATTIVRAKVFETGKVPGQIATNTYLFGETFNGLPIISVVADPETLFGDEIGIYDNNHEPVTSGRNEVYKGKDAPGYLEFFPHDGTEGFSTNGAIRIGGQNNWAGHDQKALNFSLRGKYGDDDLKYDLFPGSGIPTHSALTLREGGDDWSGSMLRDGIWNSIAGNLLDIETTNLRPSVVFLNGEYWGVYNLRSRWTEQWLFEKHGINVGEYDQVGYGFFTSNTATLGAFEGDTDDWLELLTFIDNNDINTPEDWDFVESRVNIESFIDFVASESFANNSSWRHNREFWKAHAPGSKWRWFLPDMDRTFNSLNSNIFGSLLNQDALLDRIKNQPQFKAQLAQRYAAHIATTFDPSRIETIVDTLGALSTSALDRHADKWPGGINAAEQAIELQKLKDYTTQRSLNIHAEIATELGIGSAVDLTLAVTGSGSVLLEGVPIAVGTLLVFPDLDAHMTAVPAPGFIFDSWTGLTGGSATTLNTPGNISITANFIPAPGTTINGTLAANTTLTSANSPYTIDDDLIVPAGITLTVEAGVTINICEQRNIRVIGTLNLAGTAGNEILLQGCNGELWGGVSFEEPSTTSTLAHVIVRNATRGKNPSIYPSAISGLDATVEMDFIDIAECRGPLFFRGGSTYLRDSIIHIPITGDGINIKKGYAETIRTTFLGNNAPDTDAIDYDGVINGLIKDCKIYNFRGFNSDGIDTGEQCVNVLIEGNGIYFNSDKGISVGQGSSVILRKNIIIGCPQGVGVKDFGSTILIDQNTFVDCAEGVAVFEKNFGNGGGNADITNTIFSGSTIPAAADSFSTMTVNYSLSDTAILFGTANLNTEPLFTDSSALNFQLLPASPAIDTGDPAHAPDPDTTRVDIGANYFFNAADYPFTLGQTVVINEILSNSGPAPDWIELHNRTSTSLNIGGWFLSDSATDLAKYRIPPGTIIPAGGFLTYYEDLHFGAASTDPNRITGFALSDDGETVYLSSAVADQLTDYRFEEDFGASLLGETQGFYFKPSSNNYNFLPLSSPTPNSANTAPRLGPIVISEIMYNPAGNGDAEYLELLNVSDQGITLFDEDSNTAWRFTSGIEYEFPAINTIALTPGERLILTNNIPAFNSEFTVPAGTQLLEWTTGKLSNSGESIQLGRPGPTDASNFIQFVRVDRVNYQDNLPWPILSDGTGPSLSKISEKEYGNDFINWTALAPSPGDISPGDRFATWATTNGITDPNADPDHDGQSNLLEYAFNTDPNSSNASSPLHLNLNGSDHILSYEVDLTRTDIDITLQESLNLIDWITPTLSASSPTPNRLLKTLTKQSDAEKRFHRIRVSLKP